MMVSPESLMTLLRDAQQKILQLRFSESLRIIREAKILDLQNLYITAFEQWVSKLPYEYSAASQTAEYKHQAALFVDRACADFERRRGKRIEASSQPDARQVEVERIKNIYFHRTDELLERKDYDRALEEVRRIYIFDATNIVVKEYEQKIEQLISLAENKA